MLTIRYYSTEHAIAAKRFDLFGRVAEQRAQDFVSIRAQSRGGTDHFAGRATHCPRHARMSSFTDFRMLQFNQETSLAKMGIKGEVLISQRRNRRDPVTL